MIGDRLRQARTAAGFSLRQLGERAALSAMAISKYENEQATPSSDALMRLGKALGVPIDYFFRSAKVELTEVEYRKHRRLPRKVQTRIEGDVVEQAERFFDLLDLLPQAPVARFALPAGLPRQIEKLDEIESVAERLRDAWGLGRNPIPELIDTLEERGIVVLQTEALHDNAFDGLAATVNGVPVVVVGVGWPGDRQRFTLAHELGHLVLKGRLAPSVDEETAAHRFAGAFLVPRGEVLKELGEKRTWLEPAELCALKKAYGLSMTGWMHRALDLGVVSAAVYKRMHVFFSSRGWRKKEPCDEYPREVPKLFEQLVFRALGEELVSESKAAELLRLPLPAFIARRNLQDAKTTRHK